MLQYTFYRPKKALTVSHEGQRAYILPINPCLLNYLQFIPTAYLRKPCESWQYTICTVLIAFSH